jgi:hypothetical protein
VGGQDETTARSVCMLSLKGAALQHEIALRMRGGLRVEGGVGEGEEHGGTEAHSVCMLSLKGAA